MPDEPGRIIGLQVENFKGVRAVELAFDEADPLTLIVGANDAGKTSVIDALAAAIGGERLCPAEPIRRGEDSAQAVVTTERYVITRRWWRNRKTKGLETDLRVTGADGARFPSPQALLDSFLGDLTFDPLRFMGQKDGEQRDRLLELTGLGEQLGALDAAREATFAERTETSREAKRLQATLDSEYAGLPDAKPEVPDSAALAANQRANVDAREAHGAKQRAAEDARERLEERIRQVVSIERQITDLEEARQKAVEAQASASEVLTAAEESVEASPLPPVEDLTYQIEAATAAQATADRWARREATRAAHAAKAAEADALTDKLEEIAASKKSLLAGADFPVPGLEFDEDGVVRFEGVPLKQCSSSQQLRVSMAVGMRANPALKIMLVDEGEKLDASRKAIIRELAAAEGYQVLMTCVDESAGAVGVVIEDGTTKA